MIQSYSLTALGWHPTIVFLAMGVGFTALAWKVLGWWGGAALIWLVPLWTLVAAVLPWMVSDVGELPVAFIMLLGTLALVSLTLTGSVLAHLHRRNPDASVVGIGAFGLGSYIGGYLLSGFLLFLFW